MANNLQLSVVTVTYNSEHFINEYLDYVLKYLPDDSEVIIVDNNSQDQTREIVQKSKKIQLIENSENIGFGKASNKGAEASQGDYLLFLNPDTKVNDNSIKKLLSYIKENEQIGIVVPKLIEPSGKVQESVKREPTIIGAFKEYIFGIKNSYRQYAPQSNIPVEVEAAYGAALMIKKEIFKKIGGFDEKYFLYYEDLDLCRKVRKLGYKIIYYPQAQIFHQVGASAKNIKTSALPFIIRTLANFIPMKSSGGVYYQMKSGNIYHGVLNAFFIRLVIYLGTKLRSL